MPNAAALLSTLNSLCQCKHESLIDLNTKSFEVEALKIKVQKKIAAQLLVCFFNKEVFPPKKA